jgi:gliding motility-associated-like protein
MAELLNGAFNCTNMLNHLDTMIARIQPEMQRHCNRWGGAYSQWQTNVQYLRNQISGRCAVYNQAFDTCYTVNGPYHLAVDVYPHGAGTVTIGNTTTPANYVYTSNYFGGVNISFKANADTGYVFSHWQTVSHAPVPSTTVDSMYFNMGTTTDSVVAVFVPADSVSLTVYVNPGGAGNITVNGNTPTLYPQVFRFAANTPLTVSEAANTGYTFTGWNILHHTLSPNNTSQNVSFTISQNDTLVANYSVNPDTLNLMVLVSPALGGNVSVNGNTPGSYPAVLQFVGGSAVNTVANANTGFAFTNWTLLHHALTPSNTSASANFTIAQSDTLTANFISLSVDSFDMVVDVAPNHLAGKVIVAGITPNGYPWKGHFAQGTHIDFDAQGNVVNGTVETHHYVFERYSFIYNTPVPNSTTPIVFINLQQPDTVVAWFKEEPASNGNTDLQIWIPSAFTPDGVNSVFRLHPRSEVLADCNMQIYNRWGQKVFESNNQGYGWNGEFNAKPCAMGVYTYLLSGKRQNGDDVFTKGTVTLIR